MIHNCDVLEGLTRIAAGSVQCVVTSPPYWGLRDYGIEGQLGHEPLHDCGGWVTGQPCGECYVCHMVEVFRGVRRVLRDDGVVWLNLGDSYVGYKGANYNRTGRRGTGEKSRVLHSHDLGTPHVSGLKPKDLIGIPWRVALALQADGWYLRSDAIWHKPNPMPESVTDRPTRAHEYIFLLAKQARYYYDAEAIAELSIHAGETRVMGKKSLSRAQAEGAGVAPSGNGLAADMTVTPTRNARSVWRIPTRPYGGAHFAAFPPDLPHRCIMAGSRPGDLVLDPFAGSGTALAVALMLGRRAIGIEINPEYVKLIAARIAALTPIAYDADTAQAQAEATGQPVQRTLF